MTPNDALRNIASVLQVGDAKLVEIFQLGGATVDQAAVASYLKPKGDEGFAPCPPDLVAHFLNGLVIKKRGQEKGRPPAPLESVVTNNVILKKVRIAFELKDADVAATFSRAGVPVSKSERAAFFRHRDDPHYRDCSDAMLSAFLTGMTGPTP